MIYNSGCKAPQWEDLRVPLLTVKVPSEGGPGFSKMKDNGAGSVGVYVYAFDNATEESVYFMCQMPHAWIEGDIIYPHIHWTPAVTGDANQKVAWGLEYTFAAVNGSFGNTTLIYGDTPEGWAAGHTLTAGKHYMTNIGTGINLSAITTVSSMIVCRLFRDATASGASMTDDLAQDALALEFDFHYANKQRGSDTVLG